MCYITESAIDYIAEQDARSANCELCGSPAYELNSVEYAETEHGDTKTVYCCDPCKAEIEQKYSTI